MVNITRINLAISIKNLGHKIFQFWFEDSRDYEDFRANILAYKMSSTTIKDDK